MKPVKDVDEYITLAPKELQGRLKELSKQIKAMKKGGSDT